MHPMVVGLERPPPCVPREERLSPSILLGRLGPSHLFNVALSTMGSRSHVAVVHTVAGDELPRVLVVAVPRLFAGVQRAAVGRGARADILNAVGGGVGVRAAEAEHDGVGVGANDLSVGVEHSILLLLRDA